MKSLKNNPRLVLLFLGILLINFLLYLFQFIKSGTSSDINLILRRIDTPYKAWLNGYLGFFFNVKFVGLINWLVIPLGILYIRKNRKSLKPALKATLLAISLAILLIAIKGFFNARYQLTLYPLSTMVLLFLLINFIRDYQSGYVQHIILFLGFLIILNNIMYITLLKDKNLVPNNDPVKQGMLARMKQRISNFSVYSDTSLAFNQSPNAISKALFFFHFLDTVGQHTDKPYVVLDVIEKLNREKKILVNNYPMLYYYTGSRGVYYWSGDDTYFGARGVMPLLKGRSDGQIARFIIDSLGCSYILSSETYNLYNERFNKWINRYGKPICYDPSEFILYEVQKEPGQFPVEPLKNRLKDYRQQSSNRYYVNDSLQIIFSQPTQNRFRLPR